MWPTRSLMRAALSASLPSTMMRMLAAVAMLGDCSVAIASGSVLQELKPVTDEMLQKPDPGDWLMRRPNEPKTHALFHPLRCMSAMLRVCTAPAVNQSVQNGHFLGTRFLNAALIEGSARKCRAERAD